MRKGNSEAIKPFPAFADDRMLGDELHIKKAKQIVRGKRMIESMSGKSTVSMSTDEIMKLTRGE